MKDSVIEVKIKCGVCGFSTVKTVVIKELEVAKEIFWTCSECGTKKTVIIRKKEPEIDKEHENDEPSRYKIDNLGRKIRLDEQGNPVDIKQQIIPLTKKRKTELQHGEDVEEI
jgi:transcription elongation factor Elf1